MNTKTEDVVDINVSGEDLPSLSVSGDFLLKVHSVETAVSSLMVSVAELDETKSKVLAPFVHFSVLASTYDEASEVDSLLDATFTLENAAYLLAELTDGLKDAVNELGLLSQGTLRPEPKRVQAMKELVAEIKAALTEIDAGLDGFSA